MSIQTCREYHLGKFRYGCFHSHGGTPKWMVYFMDNPNLKWMTTGGTSMTQETTIFHKSEMLGFTQPSFQRSRSSLSLTQRSCHWARPRAAEIIQPNPTCNHHVNLKFSGVQLLDDDHVHKGIPSAFRHLHGWDSRLDPLPENGRENPPCGSRTLLRSKICTVVETSPPGTRRRDEPVGFPG